MADDKKLPPDHDHWLVRPENIRKMWIVSIVVLALTVLAEFVWHPHPHFTLDKIFGFGALGSKCRASAHLQGTILSCRWRR